jgi:putative transposase
MWLMITMAPATRREALGVEVDYSLPAQRVTRLLDRLVDQYGKPERLRTDNGPEFISRALQAWCSDKEVVLHWIELGKPTQNAYIERFNGIFRREVLDAHIFTSIRQVRCVVDEWLAEYNRSGGPYRTASSIFEVYDTG